MYKCYLQLIEAYSAHSLSNRLLNSKHQNIVMSLHQEFLKHELE